MIRYVINFSIISLGSFFSSSYLVSFLTTTMILFSEFMMFDALFAFIGSIACQRDRRTVSRISCSI